MRSLYMLHPHWLRTPSCAPSLVPSCHLRVRRCTMPSVSAGGTHCLHLLHWPCARFQSSFTNMARGYGWARGFNWSYDNEIRGPIHSECSWWCKGTCHAGWKICICQGVGYMSRKRRIDSRFLYVRVTALWLDFLHLSSISSNTNPAISFRHSGFPACTFLLILAWLLPNLELHLSYWYESLRLANGEKSRSAGSGRSFRIWWLDSRFLYVRKGDSIFCTCHQFPQTPIPP